MSQDRDRDRATLAPKSSSQTSQTVYIVQTVTWEYGDDFYYCQDDGRASLKAFRKREDAEAYRELLEEEARAKRFGLDQTMGRRPNPFHFADSLDSVSSLSEESIVRRLREMEIPITPPQPGRWGRDWDNWWHEALTTLSPEQMRLVWSLLDQLRFYQIVEMELAPEPAASLHAQG